MCPIHLGRKKDKRTQDRLRMVTARLKIFLWLPSSEQPMAGFSFIADFSESGLGLYLSEKVMPGSFVQAAFDSSTAPSYRARVMWCNRYSFEQHFLGHEAKSYRVGLQMKFITEAERQRYLSFLRELKERTGTFAPRMIF